MSKEKKETQMSLWEDSPANQCQSQEKEKEQMTTAISGQKCLDSLGRSNPNSLLGRMCKELLTSKTAWYSDRCKTTWKVKVSKSNVSLFQLQASVLGTKGTESGLLHTPTATEIGMRSEAAMEKRKKYRESIGRKTTPPGNLLEQIQMKMYPTPTAQDHSRNTVPPSIGKSRGMDLSMRVVADEIKKQKKMYPTPTTQEVEHPNMVLNEKGRRLTKDGKDSHSLNLADTMRMYPTPQARDWKGSSGRSYKGLECDLPTAVKMYPTPTVGCEEGGEQSERVERTKSGGFILRKKNKPDSTFGAKLSDAMLYLEKKQMHYSPTTNDGKNVTFPISQKNRTSLVGDMIRMDKNKPGGKLNPTFVEFLMGFPMNWTKIDQIESKPSATQSSRKSQEN